MAEQIAYLEGMLDASGRVTHLPILTLPCRIGRRVEIEVQLNDQRVSQIHAEIFERDGQLFLRDRDSTNGTFVNDVRITQPARLCDGDILRFAVVEFRFRQPSSPKDQFAADMTAIMSTGEPSFHLFGHREFLRLVAEEAVTPFFQPIVRLGSNEIAGYEVLGRGNLEGLPTGPKELFEMAATYGMEANLSELFRRVGVRAASNMVGEGFIFVNMHPAEVGSRQLIESLGELRHDYPHVPIVLELHESAMTDPTRIRQLRAELIDAGVGLAYDDFGAGQARLNELAEVPPDYIKFDASLIRRIHESPASKRQLVQQLVQMSKDIGCSTLAEGVELPEERDACEQMGFDFAQGYMFGRPRPIDVAPGSDDEPAG